MSKDASKEQVTARGGFYGISELCGMLERGEASLRRQINRGKLKPNKNGKYSLIKVKKILEEASKRDLSNNSGGASGATEGKQRKINLECQILEAKLKAIQGETISKQEHIEILLQSNQIIKQQLINLPKEVAQLTSDIEANKAVKKLIENLCNNISNQFAVMEIKPKEITEITEVTEITEGKDATGTNIII